MPLQGLFSHMLRSHFVGAPPVWGGAPGANGGSCGQDGQWQPGRRQACR